MISKQQQKFIKSLQIKKYRKQAQNFLVEGEKNVLELINSEFEINTLLVTDHFFNKYNKLIHKNSYDVQVVSKKELENVSSLVSNDSALAVSIIPKQEDFNTEIHDWVPVYESLKDPGNMGTILRICDWYGFRNIILSPDSVDLYNPKVIQASMGSYCRVSVHYIEIAELLKNTPFPVVATLLEGKDVHSFEFAEKGYLLFGNESKGISDILIKKAKEALTIPGYGQAESLNVAVASAIIMDNLRRGI